MKMNNFVEDVLKVCKIDEHVKNKFRFEWLEETDVHGDYIYFNTPLKQDKR